MPKLIAPIQPHQVYNSADAADLINISHPLLIKEINRGKIKAKYLGKGWKVLGSNLLAYIGVPSNIPQDDVTPLLTETKQRVKFEGDVELEQQQS